MTPRNFISAPHVLPLSKQQNGEEDSEGVGGERNNDDDPRTWCHVEDKPHSLLHKDNFLNVFEGFNETLELIDNAVEKNGPFNGILAFSMGTCVVTIMQALQILFPEMSEISAFAEYQERFDFAILVCPLWRNKSVQYFFSEYLPKFKIRSLIVIGENDAVVRSEVSNDIVQLFDNPTVYKHSGGHFVPTSGPNKKEFLSIFEDFVFKCD
uniref:Serine hydrolase FSH domain-containing protein n=1 Tax=Romanomermis culicivorax TaxID=13658 RepID=A0A915JI36_ROMCU